MSAANFKLSMMVLLLVYGMILPDQADADPVCAQYCLEVEYMTCPFSGDTHLPASCSCCISNAPKGCTLHLADGSMYACN